jgi:pilus assembly protein CpaC
MHPTTRRPGPRLGGLLLVLLLGGLAGRASAQTCTPQTQPIVVLLNGATRLQMNTRRPIRTVINPKEGILTIRTVDRDPTTIILTGAQPGITRLELEDADGTREAREVIVQADVEYLTAAIRRAVPLGQIQVIPNGVNSVVLAGFINRAEDGPIALAVAQSVGFTAINALRVSGVQQVQLDVCVARVVRDKARNFGFNFLQNSPNEFVGSTVGALIPVQNLPVGATSSTVGPTSIAGQTISSPPGNSNIFFGIIGRRSGFLGFLQALEVENLAKILAQPRLVALSGQPASFLAGGEQAVPVPAGLGQIGVQFEEFGTRLNFLPIVLGNGKIHLEVEPEVSALDAAAGTAVGGVVVPGRTTQRVHTTVEMESGQSFVIGGLIQHRVIASANKVPVIGQIPFLGALFSTKAYDESEEEIVVLVTPYLVDAQSCDQVAKILPGQETRSPDDFELFLEGILEAPRGPRQVFHGNRYVPAYRNGPNGGDLNGGCNGHGPCGLNGNGNGNGNGAPPVAAPVPGPVGPGAVPGGLGAAGVTPPAEKAERAERADSVTPPAEAPKGAKSAADVTPAPPTVPTPAGGAQPGALPSGIRPGSAD